MKKMRVARIIVYANFDPSKAKDIWLWISNLGNHTYLFTFVKIYSILLSKTDGLFITMLLLLYFTLQSFRFLKLWKRNLKKLFPLLNPV